MVTPPQNGHSTMLWNSREDLLRHQSRAFRDLVHHVWGHSRFYRDLLSDHGIREEDIPDLGVEDLPVISKPILMENFDRAVTDSRIQREEVEEWLQVSRDSKELFLNEYFVSRSTGTSGHEALFVYDRAGSSAMASAMAGRFPAPEIGRRTKAAAIWVSHGHFTAVGAAVRMPKSIFDLQVISFLETPERIIEQLNVFQPDRIYSYSSNAATLAEYSLQGKLWIRPKNVIASGDAMTEHMENLICEAWGASVHILYASSESPFMALRDPDDAEMNVMDDLNILEVLDEDRLPVAPGERGRVVITNLFNYALPILRYDMGDFVVRAEFGKLSPYTRIRNLIGRESDTLPIVLHDGTEDRFAPGLILGEFFRIGMEKIQFVSERVDHIQIQYTGKSGIEEKIRKIFQKILEARGGGRTAFDVVRVDHIPPNLKTGKHQLVRFDRSSENGNAVAGTGIAPAPALARKTGPENTFRRFPIEEIEQSIAGRFEKQVRDNADRLAIRDNGRQMTYGDLNRAANRLAHTLLGKLGEEEAPVALLLDHDASAISAILGTLKAGKYYVPLDPYSPHPRTCRILDDSQARLIITSRLNLPFANQLGQGRIPVINLDELDLNVSSENPGLDISPDAVAYIIYTSGSTGVPKGIANNHRNLLHCIMTYTNAMHINATDRLTLFHSFSFSAARYDFYGALLNGASVFPFDVKERGFTSLPSWMAQEKITLFHFIPSALRCILDSMTEKIQFPHLRLAVLGSEPLYKRDVELWRECFNSDCILANRLGSTEAGSVRFYFLDGNTHLHGNMIPVGYPVEGYEVYLLDENGEQVDWNEEGEIVVRSPYLAWAHSPGAVVSPSAFFRNGDGRNERTFKTGDLGVMRPDGCLVHHGRKDFQLKIRGYRVELGEIETALLELDGVKEAVVHPQGNENGDHRLVAYLTLGQRSALSIKEWQRLVREKLPDYMVPSDFIVLDAFPLTSSGKVNRDALPLPTEAELEVESPLDLPRNSVEKKLVEFWKDVMGLDRIGIHDSFMDLGGHSLHAGQIIARVMGTFGVALAFRAFFEDPTVANLAEIIIEDLSVNLSSADISRVLGQF